MMSASSKTSPYEPTVLGDVTTADKIWSGDLLGRQAEAVSLQGFLESETDFLKLRGRQQAYVLGLDAPYGEGKTWFLDRFALDLARNHPVAEIDAWADDAHDQPLVALMASLETAFAGLLKKNHIGDHLAAVRTSLLPIIGKGAVAIGTKIAGSYIGDEVVKELGEYFKGLDGKTAKEGGKSAGEAIDKAIDTLIDKRADKLIEDYRKRRESIDTFRKKLTGLVQALAKPGTTTAHTSKYAPIYIIIDELDRCRPSYAIKMLEEIKHIFDVPGLVFILALHGEQLQKSISAVYGSEFDSGAYLQRFFNRNYRLRQPSIAEMTSNMFLAAELDGRSMDYPRFEKIGEYAFHDAQYIVGDLLAYWRVSPREVQRCLDCLRLFESQWLKISRNDADGRKFELPLVLNLIVKWIKRITPLEPGGLSDQHKPFTFAFDVGDNEEEQKPGTALELEAAYNELWESPISEAHKRANDGGAMGYVANRLVTEFSRDHGGKGKPLSSWTQYPALLETVGRIVRRPSNQNTD